MGGPRQPSGFHDSAAQIETILQDGGVAGALSQAPVQAMEHTGTRKKDGALRWTVRTNRCNLFVFLAIKPAQGVGRTIYEVREIGGCQ